MKPPKKKFAEDLYLKLKNKNINKKRKEDLTKIGCKDLS